MRRARHPFRVLSLATAALIALAVLAPQEVARAATISGRVFTAEHPDSVAHDVPVALIFRTADQELHHLDAKTDEKGHFHFMDLAADTSIAYVLQIDYREQQFLSTPVHFSPGEETLEFPVLIGGGGAPGGGEMPSGHPPVGGGRPAQGKPVLPNPFHTALIVLWIVLIFAGIAVITRRRIGRTGGRELPAAARELVRDIASLDNRHADGVIGEEEYRKVREGLLKRLRALTAGRPTKG